MFTMRIIRFLAGYGAVVCALPYLGLKIIWLAGGELGVANVGLMRDGSMVALNGLTAGMDVVGIAIALAFTHRWGMRLPAWLVLPPMWVATGLLSRFAMAVPIAAVARLFAAGAAARVDNSAGGPVQPWVYSVVYTGFAGLGIGLMVAFTLYARERWGFLFRSASATAGIATAASVSASSSVSADSATRGLQVPLAYAAALMAAAVALVHLAWMLGATVGSTPAVVARRTVVSHAVNAIDAGLTIAAAIGVMGIVRPQAHGVGRLLSFGGAVVLAWIGGGALFAWGLWHLIVVLGNTALIREQVSAMAFVNYLALVQFIAGLVIGFVMLVAAGEQSARQDD
jgi:hypothetical protein